MGRLIQGPHLGVTFGLPSHLYFRAHCIAPLIDLPTTFAFFARTGAMLLSLMLVRFAQKAACARRLGLASLVMHGAGRGLAVKQSNRQS